MKIKKYSGQTRLMAVKSVVQKQLSVVLFIVCVAFSQLSLGDASKLAAMSPTEIIMIKYEFKPKEVSIQVGEKIRWINKEKRQYHSVWFEQIGEDESGYLFPGDVIEKKFNKTGVFHYRCGPHPEMTGTVIVE